MYPSRCRTTLLSAQTWLSDSTLDSGRAGPPGYSTPSSASAAQSPEEVAPQPLHRRPEVKDKLENKLHDLICHGQMRLSNVRQRIASNWEQLHKDVFGVAPSG